MKRITLLFFSIAASLFIFSKSSYAACDGGEEIEIITETGQNSSDDGNRSQQYLIDLYFSNESMSVEVFYSGFSNGYARLLTPSGAVVDSTEITGSGQYTLDVPSGSIIYYIVVSTGDEYLLARLSVS